MSASNINGISLSFKNSIILEIKFKVLSEILPKPGPITQAVILFKILTLNSILPTAASGSRDFKAILHSKSSQ
ncbi:hypothetical protein HERIO_1422 [Hepatospora eriocheir]|uniref:Uncharacterized protein n=1 Tax=Hepatospora eriocheir TaxID=1081669 RepID=A0A1X0QA64_9MICR|nr:hypothetical protein HERIO_1422 [Hepatospora eriocheir]